MSVEDDKSEFGFTRRLMGRIPDVMSRALVAGTGALFLGEEGIRNLVGELKLPGEMVRGLAAQAETTKRELFRFVGHEVRSFLEQSNLSQELLKALAGVTVEVHTTIRFVPDEQGNVSPRFRSELKSIGVPGDPEGEGSVLPSAEPAEAVAARGGEERKSAATPAVEGEPRAAEPQGERTPDERTPRPASQASPAAPGEEPVGRSADPVAGESSKGE